MAFETVRNYPMAYTSRNTEWLRAAADAHPDERLAANWAVDHGDDVTVYLPGVRDLARDHPALFELKRGGAQVVTAHGRPFVRGVVLLAWPTRKALMDCLDMKLSALCVISWSPSDIRPWVRGLQPERLGPAWDDLDASRPVLDPVVQQAMDLITSMVNQSNGMGGYNRDYCVDGLTKLRSAGYPFVPDDLVADALRRGWRGHFAVELGELATQISDGRRLRVGYDRFGADIVRHWEQKAAIAPTV